MKQTFLKFLKTTISICVIIAALDLLVDNPYSQKLFSLYLNKIITRKTNLSVNIESISLSLFPLGVDFYGVQVYPNLPAVGKDTSATAMRVKIRVSLSSLFLGSPKVKLLAIEGLNLRLPAHFQPELLVKKDKHETPLDWPIVNLKLENSQLFLEMENESKEKNQIHLNDINTHLTFTHLRQFTGTFGIGSLSFDNSHQSFVRSTEWKGEIKLSGENISFKTLDIHDHYYKIQSHWSGFLSTRNPKSKYLRMNGKVSLNANLKFLEKTFQLEKTHGQAKIESNVFVNVPLNNIKDSSFLADGFLQAYDAYLSDIRVYDSTAKFAADNNGILFKDARIVIDKKEHASLTGNIAFNEKVDFNFKGSIYDFSLSKIISSFGPKFDVVDFKANTNNIAFGGTGKPFKMHLTGLGELEKIEFPPLDIPKKRYPKAPNCYANINLDFTTERLDFNNSHVLCFTPGENHKVHPPKDDNFKIPPSAFFGSRVKLHEYVDFDKGPHLSLSGQDVDLGLAQNFLQVDINGKVDVLTKIYEKNKILSISNEFSSKAFTFEKAEYPPTTGKIFVHEDFLEWKNIVSSNGKTVIKTPEGKYSWKNDLLDFHISAQNVSEDITAPSLALFKQEGLSKLKFSILTLDGHFTIPIDNPKLSAWDADTQIEHLSFENLELFRNLKFRNKVQKHDFLFENIDGYLGDLHWKGHLKYKKKSFEELLHPSDEIELDLRNYPEDRKSDFNTFPFVSQYISSLHLEGKPEFESKIEGPLNNLNGFLEARIKKFTSNQYPLYTLQLKAFLSKSQLKLFTTQPGDNFIGRIDLDLSKKEVPFKSLLTFKQFDLRPFTPSLFKKDARNFAYLSAQYSSSGNFKNFWKSIGYLKIEDFYMSYAPLTIGSIEPYQIRNLAPATIEMGQNGWSFKDKKNLIIKNNNLEFEFKLKNSNPPKNLGLYLESSLNLSDLPKFSKMFQSAHGKIYMNSSYLGPMEDIKINSRLYTKKSVDEKNNENISIGLTNLNPAFENLNVDLVYEKGVVSIKELSARKGKGSIHALGTYTSDKSKDGTHVQIVLNQAALDLSVPYLKTLHTLLSGNIVISGKEKPYNMDGNIKVIKAETDTFLDLEGEILKEYSSRRAFAYNFVEKKQPLFNLNIGLEANKSIEIKSRSLSTTLSSALNIKGNTEKPIVNGHMTIDKGRFRYKRDFVITQGEMVFDNPLKNDPKLNIVAKSQVNTYTITIYISGDSSKPLVDILVDPATKNDGSIITKLDAIVLMSTGNLPATDRSQQDTRGVVVSTGLNLYAAQLPFNKFNELTGQKFISPYVNYTTDEQGNPVPQLNVPIQLSEMIEAIIQTIPNKTSATVQVPLHDNISLSGSASSIQRTTDSAQENYQTQSGFDLKFVFPFK